MSAPVRLITVAALLGLAGCYYAREDIFRGLEPGDVAAVLVGRPAGQQLDAPAPLPGAFAGVIGSSRKAIAQADGRVLLRSLPAGTHTLLFEYRRDANGIPQLVARLNVPVRVMGGVRARVDLGTIELVKPGALHGRVQLTGVGGDLARVRVGAIPSDDATPGEISPALRVSTVDINTGEFRLEGLAPGQWRVVATHLTAVGISAVLPLATDSTTEVPTLVLDVAQMGVGNVSGTVLQPMRRDGSRAALSVPGGMVSLQPVEPQFPGPPCELQATPTGEGFSLFRLGCVAGGMYSGVLLLSDGSEASLPVNITGLVIPPGGVLNLGTLTPVLAEDCPDCTVDTPDAGAASSSSSGVMPSSSSVLVSSSTTGSSSASAGSSSMASSSGGSSSVGVSSSLGVSSVGASSAGSSSSSSSGVVPITVTPMFANATRFGEWVANPGRLPVDQVPANAAPCNAAAVNFRDECIHGGLSFSAPLTGFASCPVMTTVEDYDNDPVNPLVHTMNCGCSDVGGSPRVYCSGLRQGVYLRDLLDWSTTPVTFKPRGMRVFQDAALAAEATPVNWWDPPGALWPNTPVLTDPVQPPSQLAVVAFTAAAMPGMQWTVDVDGVSITTATGANVAMGTAGFDVSSNFFRLEGSYSPLGAPLLTTRASRVIDLQVLEIDMGSSMFGSTVLLEDPVALEVNVLNIRNGLPDGLEFHGGNSLSISGLQYFDSAGTALLAGMGVSGYPANVVVYATAVGRAGAAMSIVTGTSMFVVDDLEVDTARNASFAIEVQSNGFGTLLRNVRVSRAAGVGVVLSGDHVGLQDAIVAGCGGDGIRLQGSNKALLNVTAANNGQSGISTDAATPHNGTVLKNLTLMNNNAHGLDVLYLVGGSIMNVATINNGQNGFSIGSPGPRSNGNYVYNLVSTNNGNVGINLDQDASGFGGTVRVGNNASDCVASGSSAGITTGCGSATLTVQTGRSALAASFLPPAGAFPVTDPYIQASTAGWPAAEFFIPNGGGGISRGPCTNGTCARFSVRRLMGESVLFIDNFIPMPPTDVGNHQWALSGTLCTVPAPQANPATCVSPTWVQAFELVSNGANGNALCEENEPCLFAPNFGSYQGEGLPNAPAPNGNYLVSILPINGQ